MHAVAAPVDVDAERVGLEAFDRPAPTLLRELDVAWQLPGDRRFERRFQEAARRVAGTLWDLGRHGACRGDDEGREGVRHAALRP